MTQYNEEIKNTDFKDRTVGLILFGALYILIGAFCILMTALMLISLIFTGLFDSFTSSSTQQSLIPALLFYFFAAIWFIWLGIGSIKARRWARALILVASWLWLVTGVISTIYMAISMPQVYEKMVQSQQLSRASASIAQHVTSAVMVILYVIIPVLFVLFYGSKNVKATCEHKDTRIRWTDKCPLPVLALSLLFPVCTYVLSHP